MSMLASARRREAEDLQAMLAGGRPSTPEAGQQLAPLVALARGIAPSVHIPSQDFRAALRERLVAEAADRVPAPAAPAPRSGRTAPARLRQTVAAVAVASVVAGVGAAAASTGALPGDSLYGLKRQVEDVQLSLARGDVGRGRELLEQADARLSEAERLTAGEHATDPATRALVGQALADLETAATVGSDALTRAYRQTGDPEPMLVLDRFVTEQRERLDDLIPLLDPSLRARARALADQLASLDQQAGAVLAGPGSALAGSSPVAGSAGRPVGGVGSAASSGDGDLAGGLGSTGAARAARAAGRPGAVGGAVDAVGAVTGTPAGGGPSGGSGPAAAGSGGTSGVGGVGGVVGSGGTTSTPQLPVVAPVATPLPTSAPHLPVPVPTSSPVAGNPVTTATGAAPLPPPPAVPTVSACAPVPPLTTC